ncbi:MAG: LamB/YcsF family protein [Actinomycetota bacterium]|nr:LamB/YcsF family protein [Actinomycetota bacterium]
MTVVDLNSDLGEGLPSEIDDSLLSLVSSANVACGGHAGDEATMRRTVRVALQNGVRIGAHPSYPDRERFGRDHIDMTVKELVATLTEQLAGLLDIASAGGGRVAYLKPHGALYNDAAAGDRVAGEALMKVAGKFRLPMMMLPKSVFARWAGSVIREGFLDRAMRKDGSLVPRSEPGALITDADAVARQAVELAPTVDSLSLHSDTPGAVGLMRAAREALLHAGYEIGAAK